MYEMATGLFAFLRVEIAHEWTDPVTSHRSSDLTSAYKPAPLPFNLNTVLQSQKTYLSLLVQ